MSSVQFKFPPEIYSAIFKTDGTSNTDVGAKYNLAESNETPSRNTVPPPSLFSCFHCSTDAAPTATALTPQRNKRKATSNYQAEFFKVCTDTIKSTNKELSEFDVAGMNMAKKLAKMDPLQAIYAESIINNVLRKGLLKKLTEDTDLCDSYCNKNIQRPLSIQSSHSRSSYESQSLLTPFLPSTSGEQREQGQIDENLNLTQLRTYYEHPNLMD